MNASDVIKYGHREVVTAVEGLSQDGQSKAGVTTSWSAKDLMAHLASYEKLLEEALLSVSSPGVPTPTLDRINQDYTNFNNRQVGVRSSETWQEVWEEYQQTNQRVAKTVKSMGPEVLRRPGAIPWYGEEYSLDDYIVYANYGHKREHVAQIKIFRRRNNF